MRINDLHVKASALVKIGDEVQRLRAARQRRVRGQRVGRQATVGRAGSAVVRRSFAASPAESRARRGARTRRRPPDEGRSPRAVAPTWPLNHRRRRSQCIHDPLPGRAFVADSEVATAAAALVQSGREPAKATRVRRIAIAPAAPTHSAVRSGPVARRGAGKRRKLLQRRAPRGRTRCRARDHRRDRASQADQRRCRRAGSAPAELSRRPTLQPFWRAAASISASGVSPGNVAMPESASTPGSGVGHVVATGPRAWARRSRG